MKVNHNKIMPLYLVTYIWVKYEKCPRHLGRVRYRDSICIGIGILILKPILR
jgi:hypothetical protein